MKHMKTGCENIIRMKDEISLVDAQAAAERIWDNAERNGTADMSLDEINDIIKAIRVKRKARKIST